VKLDAKVQGRIFVVGIVAILSSFALAFLLDYKFRTWGFPLREHVFTWERFVYAGEILQVIGFVLSWFGRGWPRIIAVLLSLYLIHMWSGRGVIA
jgi:hypothetical protein